MSLRQLVEVDCGRPNSLMQLTNQATNDTQLNRHLLTSSSKGSLSDAFTEEYISQVSARTAAPSTFNMQNLLRSLPQHNQLAEQWKQQFIQSNAPNVASNWSQEYLENPATQQALLNRAWSDAALPKSQSNEISMWSSEYLANFDQIDRRLEMNATEKATQWTDQFMNESIYTNAYWQNLESEWDSLARTDPEHDWLNEFESNNMYRYKDYEMHSDNPYLYSLHPLEEGIRFWSQGDLANAILNFESAVQQDANNSEAWRYLGSAQAENEQEPNAIAALRKSLDLNPSNLDALFSLAVAYTNESMDNEALSALERWLAACPKYEGLLETASVNYRKPNTSSFLDRGYFEELEAKFLEAARRQSSETDPNLQNALAVLYNLNGNFDRAIDSLNTALAVKPDDARLWNRLGATLANSDRPTEAVAAYSKALGFYPGYVRARYNLGISCMNLKSNREAIEHFLSAIQLQQRGLGPEQKQVSDGIWNTLRSAILRLDRSDQLLKAAENGDIQQFASVFHQVQPVSDAFSS